VVRWPFGCGSRGAVSEPLLRAAQLLAEAAELLARAVAGRDQGPATPAVFTVPTLAVHLHRSASTIRGWCERGELEARRVKGRWYIRAEAVERFLGGPQPDGAAPTSTTMPTPQPHRTRAHAAGIGAWRQERQPKAAP